MTKQEIRAWYIEEIGKIGSMDEVWSKRGDTIAQRAYQAWRIRHELRLRARDLMEDRIEVEKLRDRDRTLYGNPDGPTFEDLMEALRRKGLTSEAAFSVILESARRTNAEVNALINVEKTDPRKGVS